MWEQPYYGTQPASDQLRVEEVPYYGTPSVSYQLPTAEAPYYVSEPPNDEPDYVQEPVHVKLEPLDDEGNKDDDDNYDPDYIREATVSYARDDVRHRTFSFKLLLIVLKHVLKLTL